MKASCNAEIEPCFLLMPLSTTHAREHSHALCHASNTDTNTQELHTLTCDEQTPGTWQEPLGWQAGHSCPQWMATLERLQRSPQTCVSENARQEEFVDDE